MANPSCGLSAMGPALRTLVRSGAPDAHLRDAAKCLVPLVRNLSTSTPGKSAIIPFSVRHAFALNPKYGTSMNSTASKPSASAMVPRRQISISSSPRSISLYKPFTKIPTTQKRSLFGGAESRSQVNYMLSRLEQNANNNPRKASAQDEFYKALLMAKMPAIVVERYNTGQFASNYACKQSYEQALANIGGVSPVSSHNAKLQPEVDDAIKVAVQAAVASQRNGGNTASVKSTTGTDGPIAVTVGDSWGKTFYNWARLILIFGIVVYFLMMLSGMLIEGMSQFTKTTNRAVSHQAKPEQQKARFSDVHGCEEAKEELQELVEFLKNPTSFNTLGGKLPKGVLLVGPPGTGKTLLARAVAGEAGVPFFFVSGSEFDEMYVGVGAKRVRELFTAAKAKSPAIIFIDELDAVGGKRTSRDQAYSKQTLNQLLTELDGFQQNTGVIIMAATNFPEALDKALTRPGRFDRNIVVGLPDVRGRLAILKHHITKIVAAPDVNLEVLAATTIGWSGAQLENVVNQAAVHASRAKASFVSAMDFEWAKDKINMGAEKKSMVITDKELLMTAYHEAGHALVVMYTKDANKLHKVTVMPRGWALGVTYHVPEMDQHSHTLMQLRSNIDVSMGGKAAEAIVYGQNQVTSGASSDIQNATNIAYSMVTRFGMSPELGNMDLASNYESQSSETKRLVESEVRRFVEEGYERAEKLLKAKRTELDRLAKGLVDYETLSREEAEKIIRGEELPGRTKLPKGSKIMIPVAENQEPDLPPIPGSKPEGAGPGAPPTQPGAVA